MLEKFKIDKKLLKQVDYGIIFTCIIIASFGMVNIFSATQTRGSNVVNLYYLKLQLIWLAIGLLILYIIMALDYSFIGNYAGVIYWFLVVVQLFNDLTSKAIKGQNNWIKIGSRAIQPSEFLKIAMIIMLAKKINDMEGNVNTPKNFFTLLFYAILPMVLIVVDSDMGMTMVCFFIALGIFFMAGLNLKIIFGGISGIVAFIVLVWNSGLIKGYQKLRLSSFINQSNAQADANFQLTQSKISIGSGGLFGSGFLKGTGYIPEQHTDFIFSVLGKEWGLIGASAALLLYGILIYKYISIAKTSKDIFGSILCVGVISSFLFSILENIGMCIGIMPISGITLPFISYGGSSMLANFIGVGLILNVGMRRKKINF